MGEFGRLVGGDANSHCEGRPASWQDNTAGEAVNPKVTEWDARARLPEQRAGGNGEAGGRAKPEQPTVGAEVGVTCAKAEGRDGGETEGEAEAIISGGTEKFAASTTTPGS